MRGKRGQHTMSLPFGLIFSIILIVVFVVIAFIAVKYFLGIGSCSEIGLFYDDFQSEINNAMSAQEYSDVYELTLPSGITRVCFANLSETITNAEDYEFIKNYYLYEANVFLLPPEKACNMPYKFIQKLNIAAITSSMNPYCVEVSRELRIKKGIYDKSILVE
jgi:hypothetical protein